MRGGWALRAAVAALAAAVLAVPSQASAEDFGFGTTAAPPNADFTCANGVPYPRSAAIAGAPRFVPGTGQKSCTWTSVGGGSGLYVPGTGTVTSVTLPPL